MKFCVIGLGRLGYQVATGLAENGMEVMAIDSDETIIASIRDDVTQAICMRVTDEDSLKSIGIEEIETAIVATGENFAQSILITALLKKLNVPNVIARAVNAIHKDILRVLGADRIILPEREVGKRLADNLSTPFKELIRMTTDFSISQIDAPQPFIGQKISDIATYANYSVHLIGIHIDDETVVYNPEHVIEETDRLIFSGNNKSLERLSKL